jgi:XTP/dITP diphosphohydrolase
MKRVLIATTNKGKLREYQSYLSPLGYKIVSLDELGVSAKAPEEGSSFLEIAEKKALFYSKYTKLPIVTDDSGLEILALEGFPGVKSDRWFVGSEKEKNMEILKNLSKITDRRAVFTTVVVYLHKKTIVRFEGKLFGEIAHKPEGSMGFGYDPIFYVPKMKRTLAQILLFEKNEISHRAQAMRKLVSYLKKYRPR